jgi:hypothetical protein
VSTLGFYSDAPNKIQHEGSEITIKFEKTSDTTARISWTLPKASPGCSIADAAYNGIVIVLDTVAIDQQRTVTNGVYYTGDPTADTNLFAGDKIDTAMVVGAFYDDKTTTYVDITGIKNNTPYYVAGFAVDNVCQYHLEGVHSYSQHYGTPGTEDTAGYQLINYGINGADPTGLIPTLTYSFRLVLDGLYQLDLNTGNAVVTVPGKTYDINVLGSNAATFDDLLANLNYQLAALNNPYQGSVPPNTNGYYYNTTTKQLYQWDGYKYTSLNPIVSATTPTTPNNGDYWYEQDTNTLYQWNGSSWDAIQAISYKKEPNQVSCDEFWFDGTKAYLWDGSVWIPLNTYIQEMDPAGTPKLACNSYWFDESTNTLSYWKDFTGTCNTGDVTSGAWESTMAILWPTDPRVPVTNEYWYDETSGSINQWNGTSWVKLTTAFSISTTAPTLPAINFAWYNPTTEILLVWNGVDWVDTPIILWVRDPLVTNAGELWWDTTTDLLYIWDILTSSWVSVSNFTISSTNPANAIAMTVDDAWYVPSTKQLSRWDGSQWCQVDYINWSTNPILPTTGEYYYNTTSNQWFMYNGTVWVAINYIEYNTSPTSPTLGGYWFNSSTNSLNQWNGSSWVTLMYSVNSLTPTVGTNWYNTTDSTLYKWDGKWVSIVPPAYAVMDSGNIAIFSGTRGGLSSVYITDGNYVQPPFPYGLFGSTIPTGKILTPVNGGDGVETYPTWSLQGIGTDGSSDERRDMVESILLELGYPTVQVELTKEQLDFCIDQALQTLRRSSSSAYERVFFFLDLWPGQQHYILSDKLVGFNKVVNVMGLHRMTASFLGAAEGQGVYGQVMLQQLYNMGTFDLVSYHIMNEYVELMEKLFASNLMYKWNERKRQLSLMQTIWRNERVLLDATIERTEQDILGDRMLNNWIQTWATAEARMILAEIRGKFQTLPGAGGGISLNAQDLRAQADKDFERCLLELDEFIATDIEEYGLGSTIIMG